MAQRTIKRIVFSTILWRRAQRPSQSATITATSGQLVLNGGTTNTFRNYGTITATDTVTTLGGTFTQELDLR